LKIVCKESRRSWEADKYPEHGGKYPGVLTGSLGGGDVMQVDEDQRAIARESVYEYLVTNRRRRAGGDLAPPSAAWPSNDDRKDDDDGAFEVRERWEGVVEEICDTFFVATVHDMFSDEVATAEIKIEDIPPVDRPLLRLGALFYWYIGYQQKRNGLRTKMSFLHFRRARPLGSGSAEPSAGWLDDDEPAGDQPDA
jgi:hypothetical protein